MHHTWAHGKSWLARNGAHNIPYVRLMYIGVSICSQVSHYDVDRNVVTRRYAHQFPKYQETNTEHRLLTVHRLFEQSHRSSKNYRRLERVTYTSSELWTVTATCEARACSATRYVRASITQMSRCYWPLMAYYIDDIWRAYFSNGI